MFAVFNKDVILQISITALLLVTIFPWTVLARSGKITHDKKIEYGNKNRAAYVRHKKYLKSKKTYNIKGKIPKRNIPADAHNHTPSIKKTTPEKNNILRYTVKKGDTLSHISKKYNIPLASILTLNKLKNENNITKGLILKVPLKRSSCTSRKNIVDKQNSNSNVIPRFQWPVHHVVGYHNDGLNGVKSIGIIITGKPGSTVLSSAPGTVKKIGSMRGFGKYVVIHHSGRYATVYANLDRITVSEGDKIQAGNAIGKINYFDRKLHFQIDLEGKPENPLKYLPKNI